MWFVAAFVAHDLVLFPIYALAHRILGVSIRRGVIDVNLPSRHATICGCQRLAQGLILLIFFPGIIKQGVPLFHEDTA